MLDVVRQVLLVARVRGHITSTGALAAVTITIALLPTGVLAVPGRPEVFALVWPLGPALAAVVFALIADRQHTLAEAHAPHAQRHVFADHIVFTALGGALLAAVWTVDRGMLERNFLFSLGLFWLSTAVLGHKAGWFPLLLACTATWLLGSGIGGAPKPWALLLLPTSGGTWSITAMLFVTGLSAAIVTSPARRTA